MLKIVDNCVYRKHKFLSAVSKIKRDEINDYEHSGRPYMRKML